MRTMAFTVTIELTGFDEAQEAGEWLEAQLENLCQTQMVSFHDFEISPDVTLITYPPQ